MLRIDPNQNLHVSGGKTERKTTTELNAHAPEGDDDLGPDASDLVPESSEPAEPGLEDQPESLAAAIKNGCQELVNAMCTYLPTIESAGTLTGEATNNLNHLHVSLKRGYVLILEALRGATKFDAPQSQWSLGAHLGAQGPALSLLLAALKDSLSLTLTGWVVMMLSMERSVSVVQSQLDSGMEADVALSRLVIKMSQGVELAEQVCTLVIETFSRLFYAASRDNTTSTSVLAPRAICISMIAGLQGLWRPSHDLESVILTRVRYFVVDVPRRTRSRGLSRPASVLSVSFHRALLACARLAVLMLKKLALWDTVEPDPAVAIAMQGASNSNVSSLGLVPTAAAACAPAAPLIHALHWIATPPMSFEIIYKPTTRGPVSNDANTQQAQNTAALWPFLPPVDLPSPLILMLLTDSSSKWLAMFLRSRTSHTAVLEAIKDVGPNRVATLQAHRSIVSFAPTPSSPSSNGTSTNAGIPTSRKALPEKRSGTARVVPSCRRQSQMSNTSVKNTRRTSTKGERENANSSVSEKTSQLSEPEPQTIEAEEALIKLTDNYYVRLLSTHSEQATYHFPAMPPARHQRIARLRRLGHMLPTISRLRAKIDLLATRIERMAPYSLIEALSCSLFMHVPGELIEYVGSVANPISIPPLPNHPASAASISNQDLESHALQIAAMNVLAQLVSSSTSGSRLGALANSANSETERSDALGSGVIRSFQLYFALSYIRQLSKILARLDDTDEDEAEEYGEPHATVNMNDVEDDNRLLLSTQSGHSRNSSIDRDDEEPETGDPSLLPYIQAFNILSKLLHRTGQESDLFGLQLGVTQYVITLLLRCATSGPFAVLNGLASNPSLLHSLAQGVDGILARLPQSLHLQSLVSISALIRERSLWRPESLTHSRPCIVQLMQLLRRQIRKAGETIISPICDELKAQWNLLFEHLAAILSAWDPQSPLGRTTEAEIYQAFIELTGESIAFITSDRLGLGAPNAVSLPSADTPSPSREQVDSAMKTILRLWVDISVVCLGLHEEGTFMGSPLRTCLTQAILGGLVGLTCTDPNARGWTEVIAAELAQIDHPGFGNGLSVVARTIGTLLAMTPLIRYESIANGQICSIVQNSTPPDRLAITAQYLSRGDWQRVLAFLGPRHLTLTPDMDTLYISDLCCHSGQLRRIILHHSKVIPRLVTLLAVELHPIWAKVAAGQLKEAPQWFQDFARSVTDTYLDEDILCGMLDDRELATENWNPCGAPSSGSFKSHSPGTLTRQLVPFELDWRGFSSLPTCAPTTTQILWSAFVRAAHLLIEEPGQIAYGNEDDEGFASARCLAERVQLLLLRGVVKFGDLEPLKPKVDLEEWLGPGINHALDLLASVAQHICVEITESDDAELSRVDDFAEISHLSNLSKRYSMTAIAYGLNVVLLSTVNSLPHDALPNTRILGEKLIECTLVAAWIALANDTNVKQAETRVHAWLANYITRNRSHHDAVPDAGNENMPPANLMNEDREAIKGAEDSFAWSPSRVIAVHTIQRILEIMLATSTTED